MKTAVAVARIALAAVLPVLASDAAAQVAPGTPRPPAPSAPARPDTLRRPQPAPDTTATRRAPGPRRATSGAAPRPDLRPPVTPRRALISSLLVPGLGQTRLDRPTAGAVFVAAEIAGVAMLGKSLADLGAARALRRDSITLVIPVDTLGRPTGQPVRRPGGFSSELVRARSLHVEDWIAFLFFNHLLSGAEAFVAAQLYDLPAQISAQPGPRGGVGVALSLAW